MVYFQSSGNCSIPVRICKHVFSIRVENIVDLDLLAADLDLQCLQKKDKSGHDKG